MLSKVEANLKGANIVAKTVIKFRCFVFSCKLARVCVYSPDTVGK
jgi:hypothetical protein